MLRERDNFVHFTENIKYGNLKKNMAIYHKEGEKVNDGAVFTVILSNEIMQNHNKNTPQKV